METILALLLVPFVLWFIGHDWERSADEANRRAWEEYRRREGERLAKGRR